MPWLLGTFCVASTVLVRSIGLFANHLCVDIELSVGIKYEGHLEL